MNVASPLLGSLKVTVLTFIVVTSFTFSSLGWRHIETEESARVCVGAVILLSLYALLVFELVDRNLAALIGAAVSVAAYDCLVERVSMEEILRWEDLETLSLLFGMMVIVNVLGCSGLFDFLAVWSYKKAAGRFWLLIVIMALISVLLSSFIDNVSCMLLISPTLIKLSQLERIDPRYLLMIMVVFANIGGSATPVGDPPNLIIIGNKLTGQLGVTFGSFVAYCAPCVLLTTGAILLYLRLVYRSKDSFRPPCAEFLRDSLTVVSCSDCGQQAPSGQLESGEQNDNSSGRQQQMDKLKRELAQVVERRPANEMLNADKRRLMQAIEEQVSLAMTRSSTQSSGQPEGLVVLHEGQPESCRARLSSRLSEGAIEHLLVIHSIKSGAILAQSLGVLAVAVLLFFVQSLPGTNLTLGWISLFASLTLLVLSSNAKICRSQASESQGGETPDESATNFEHVIKNIEWSTLMFFFGLFIVMEVMTKLGLIKFLGLQITSLVEQLPEGPWRSIGAITVILWASGVASAIIDNVPFTSMMVEVLAAMAGSASLGREAAQPLDMRPLLFALAFGACYGGNATLIGASANLVTASVAARHGHPITFNTFAKFALPPTLISLVVANLYLVLVFVFLGL